MLYCWLYILIFCFLCLLIVLFDRRFYGIIVREFTLRTYAQIFNIANREIVFRTANGLVVTIVDA